MTNTKKGEREGERGKERRKERRRKGKVVILFMLETAAAAGGEGKRREREGEAPVPSRGRLGFQESVTRKRYQIMSFKLVSHLNITSNKSFFVRRNVYV